MACWDRDLDGFPRISCAAAGFSGTRARIDREARSRGTKGCPGIPSMRRQVQNAHESLRRRTSSEED